MIVEVAEQDFDSKVVTSTNPSLVDFWAPWCGPCKMAEPVLEELSKQHTGKVDFYKVDVDQNPGLASKYGVMSIPTTILFRGGQEVGRQIGFGGKQKFVELLEKVWRKF